MKGDIPAAALRLMACCRSTIHERTAPNYESRLSANNMRAVRINGCVYESLADAGRRLRKSRGAIRLMIDKGLAKYA